MYKINIVGYPTQTWHSNPTKIFWVASNKNDLIWEKEKLHALITCE